jgi:DME family drug/metabolite transporter
MEPEGAMHTEQRASHTLGIAFALGAGLLWGTLGFVSRELLDRGLTPSQLALIRMGGAFGVTLLIVYALGKLRWPTSRELCWLLLIGVFCQALSAFAFSASVQRVGGNLAVVLLCTGPLFTACLARIVLAERLALRGWSMVTLALVGLALIVLPLASFRDAAADIPRLLSGLGCGLIAGLCFGAFPVFARKLGNVDPWWLVAYTLGIGTLVLLPFQSAPVTASTWSPVVLLWCAVLVLVPTVLADIFYVQAIPRAGALLATQLALVEVPASALYAWWFERTPVLAWQWIGIAVFCLGLVGLALTTSTHAAMPETPSLPHDSPEARTTA